MNYFSEANKSYNERNYEKAIEIYKLCIKKDENTATCLYNTAVCFIKLQKYKEAVLYIQKALLLKKESKYYFNLGYCYCQLKEYKKALLNFNRASAMDETDEDCIKAMDFILREIGR